MEGILIFKIGEVEREFNFGNYALEQTLDEMGIAVTDLSEVMRKRLLVFMRTFIYHAACYPILDRKETPDFTPFDVHKWIDVTGGSQGEFMKTASQKIYQALGMTESEDTEQKKTLKKVG